MLGSSLWTWHDFGLGTLGNNIFNVAHQFFRFSSSFSMRRHHESSRVAWTALIYGVFQVSLMAKKKEIAHRSPLAVTHRSVFTLRWVTLKVLRLLHERGVEQSNFQVWTGEEPSFAIQAC